MDEKKRLLARAQIEELNRAITKLPANRTREILVRLRARIQADAAGGVGGTTTSHTIGSPGPMRLPIPRSQPLFPDPQLQIPDCERQSIVANARLAGCDNHFWQNWGKTHAYICKRMLFPTSVAEISAAIRMAESDGVPIRAVGGGWSFSDCNLPGDVFTSRPAALGVEALAEVIPSTETFSDNPLDEIVAAIEDPPPGGPPDDVGSLLMWSPARNGVDPRWTYQGAGAWSVEPAAVDELMNVLNQEYVFSTGIFFLIGDTSSHHIDQTALSESDYPVLAYESGYRPLAAAGGDVPGSLIFHGDTGGYFGSHFYNGNGIWTLNVFDSEPQRLALRDVMRLLPRHSQLRPSTPAFSVSLWRLKKNGYVVNTQSLMSSLQQSLPDILSSEALGRFRPGPGRDATHYFHVEAGITMEALSELLQHQSPRLALETSGGSPGATLAGALATATHGGEYNRPLLADRVKAVHLVGPGGLEWWIEGAESIADPDKLIARYPCLDRTRIIAGTAPVAGLTPEEWLNAVVVSLGCLGVAYSFVLEVVPLYGIHEKIVALSWSEFLAKTTLGDRPVSQDVLRDPPSAPEDRHALGEALLQVLRDGRVNGTGIRAEDNRYIDLAIDPNPFFPVLLGPVFHHVADYDCWVLNREVTATLPIDPNPPPKAMIGRIADSLQKAAADPGFLQRLEDVYGLEFLHRDIVSAVVNALHEAPRFVDKLLPLFSATDTIDSALSVLAASIDQAGARDVARVIVSAFFSGLLGVENGVAESSDVVSRVGAIGFPASGIMGAGLEVALAPGDAFSFIQTEILDRLTTPFFGYVSVRICPRTGALLGMQQFDPSVMVEVVAFATTAGRNFVTDLQQRTLARIRGGLNAMLHWGLENDLLDGPTLHAIPAWNEGSPSKLDKFKTARRFLQSAAPGSAPHVFDNYFTRRLGL